MKIEYNLAKKVINSNSISSWLVKCCLIIKMAIAGHVNGDNNSVGEQNRPFNMRNVQLDIEIIIST